MAVVGTRESTPWFFGWLFMTVMAGVFDYLLPANVRGLDMSTIAVFFVLNFSAISIMIYGAFSVITKGQQRSGQLSERYRLGRLTMNRISRELNCSVADVSRVLAMFANSAMMHHCTVTFWQCTTLKSSSQLQEVDTWSMIASWQRERPMQSSAFECSGRFRF